MRRKAHHDDEPFADPESAYRCTNCGCEYTDRFRGTHCTDCGGPIIDRSAVQLLDTQEPAWEEADPAAPEIDEAFQRKAGRLYRRHLLAIYKGLVEGEELLRIEPGGEAGDQHFMKAVVLAALTSYRVIVVRGMPLQGLSVAEVLLGDVYEAQFDPGAWHGPLSSRNLVVITARSGDIAFQAYSGGSEFAAAVLDQIRVLEQEAVQQSSLSTAPDDISSQLAQLAALHRNGDLSDEEFARAKERLLGM